MADPPPTTSELDELSPDTLAALAEVIDDAHPESLATFVRLIAPEDTAYTVSRLDEGRRTTMLDALAVEDPDLAASILGHFDDTVAAQMLNELDAPKAAAIVDLLDSDEQTDVLADLPDTFAEEVLQEMDPEEAQDARQRLVYGEDTAGGRMITEYLLFEESDDVADVIRDLKDQADRYDHYESRYVYVTDGRGHLSGVVPMRSLVLAHHGRRLAELAKRDPVTASVHDPLEELEDMFDRYAFSAIPVLDDDGLLAGVIQRHAVHEAVGERESENLMKFGGIVGGEEVRSMPVLGRAGRRLLFLLPNIALSYAAVSIIAAFEPVIEKLTALAVFIPMVANLSGAAGNQAVAVSIREQSLGLVEFRDVIRVWRAELLVGLVNGAVIGTILAILVLLLWHNTVLAGSVGGAYALNCVFAVLLGGALPLALKAMKVDPAMVSSPILTTLTDMVGFLLVLGIAAVALSMGAVTVEAG
ncbi:MAG: magnesium transporter [Planctomycetota bacterium]